MRFVVHLLILLLVGWVSNSAGYNSGLRASPEYVQMKNEERAARDARWAADDLRVSQHQTPDVEECLPVMELFEQDIMGYCGQVFMEYENERSLAREDEYRSPYE